MTKILVGSHNPIKIAAVRESFALMYPDHVCDISGISAPSGVTDQPMTDTETLQGATNRVNAMKQSHPDADFWVGVEGGIEIDDQGQGRCFAWMVVASPMMMTKAKSACCQLPPKVIELVQTGMELGDADDQVFGQTNSKQQMGAIGLLTHGVIDRQGYYTHALVMAWVPHYRNDLYV